jgi:hypothetical protein
MQWPTGMEPGNSSVYARNEIVIPVQPERVWRWLCRAARWPEWYDNCAWLRFRNSAGPDLESGTAFVWKTFGVRVRSMVLTFEPTNELGWDATAFGLRAYHGWVIEPLESGSRVITEETQQGPLSTFGRWYLRRALLREHQNWLESLSRVARSGDPG